MVAISASERCTGRYRKGESEISDVGIQEILLHVSPIN